MDVFIFDLYSTIASEIGLKLTEIKIYISRKNIVVQFSSSFPVILYIIHLYINLYINIFTEVCVCVQRGL